TAVGGGAEMGILRIRRAAPPDTADAAAVFSAAFRSMEGVPKLHSDDEDRVFVRGLIANKETWLPLVDGPIPRAPLPHRDLRLPRRRLARDSLCASRPSGSQHRLCAVRNGAAGAAEGIPALDVSGEPARAAVL